MSIKSQKSLEEECSEIIERGYLVKTPSETSLSGSDDESALARDLVRRLRPAALSQLRRRFRTEGGGASDIDSRVEEVMRAAAEGEGVAFPPRAPAPPDARWLDEAGFVAAVAEVFGGPKYSPHARQLFQLLDPWGSGRVSWGRLLDRMVEEGARKTRSRADGWTPVEVGGVRQLEHCKRETIVKFVSIEQSATFCYAAVSRRGRVGVYDGELKLLCSYEVFYHRTGIRRRVKNCWITDAIYLPDVKYLILSASDRSLTFYDAATLTHTPIYVITGLPNIPTCLSHAPATAQRPLELAFGTECGDVIRLLFLQPAVSLFYTSSIDRICYYFWMELSSSPHSSYVSTSRWRRVHSRTVRRLCHTRGGDVLLSCSHDSVVSIRARHVPGKMDDYVFKVQRGVTCMAVVPPLRLLASGSADGAVRLWGLGRAAAPFAVLRTTHRPHQPRARAVLDVAVAAGLVVAYCGDCSISIWDLYEECLVQSVRVRFPFLGVAGRKVEFGSCCLFPGPPRQSADSPARAVTVTDTRSRRGSAVATPSGGLALVDDGDADDRNQDRDEDKERAPFDRGEVLVTCCDWVCRVPLTGPASHLGAPLPPPGDTPAARRPSWWDLDDDTVAGSVSSQVQEPVPSQPSTSAPVSVHLLSPADAEVPQDDLDTLLEKAGLEGLLQKDFVLMAGLKSDLNKKLAEMHRNLKNHVVPAAIASANTQRQCVYVTSGEEIPPINKPILKLAIDVSSGLL